MLGKWGCNAQFGRPPRHLLKGHLHIERIINQLNQGHRGGITSSRAQTPNARISARPLSISFCQHSPDLFHNRLSIQGASEPKEILWVLSTSDRYQGLGIATKLLGSRQGGAYPLMSKEMSGQVAKEALPLLRTSTQLFNSTAVSHLTIVAWSADDQPRLQIPPSTVGNTHS